MNNLLTKAVLGVTLGASVLVAAAPAEAQHYRYNRHGGGGTAAVAGIAGLAIGAALASSANRGYRDRWYRDNGYNYNYDDYYYRNRGYYPNDGYYAYQSQNYRDCWTERRYDPYYGRNVRVRVCN